MQRKDYEVQKEELLFDFRLLAEGIFDGELLSEEDALLIYFRNGQKFRIKAEDIQNSGQNKA